MVRRKKVAPNPQACRGLDDEKKHFDFRRAINHGMHFSTIQTKGRREYMEDYICTSYRKNRTSMFAVYDGHGGSSAAKFCAEKLFKLVKEHSSFSNDLKKSLRDSFLRADHLYQEIAKSNGDDDGSTATLVCLQGSTLSYANVGDSKCILIKKNKTSRTLTKDHTCESKNEQVRIRNENGQVTYDKEDGCYRVDGVLAVTRAIGDSTIRCITAEPELGQVNLTNADSYIVIASDGLWDSLNSREVSAILSEQGRVRGIEELVTQALERGSEDNISVIVIEVASVI